MLDTDDAETPFTLAAGTRQRPKARWYSLAPQGLLTWHDRSARVVHVMHPMLDTWTTLIHTLKHIPHSGNFKSRRFIHTSVIVHVCLWSPMSVCWSCDRTQETFFNNTYLHTSVLSHIPKYPVDEYLCGDLGKASFTEVISLFWFVCFQNDYFKCLFPIVPHLEYCASSWMSIKISEYFNPFQVGYYSSFLEFINKTELY